MVRYDGTFYQPMIFHDGSTFTAGSLFVRPSTYYGTAKLDRLIFRATGNSAGNFTVKINGSAVTGSIAVPAMTDGQVREYVFKPSDFTAGKSPKIKGTDIVVIDFGGSPANFYVGVVFK